MLKPDLNRYPFLRVYDAAGDQVPGISHVDFVPEGWQSLFMEACEKIRARLDTTGNLDTYQLTDVKEKYGSLRIYDNLYDSNDEHTGVTDIIQDTEHRSETMCIVCGKPLGENTVRRMIPCCQKHSDIL